MRESQNKTLGITRNVIASALLFAALAIRADESGFDTRKEAAGAPPTRESAAQKDPATCIKQAAEMNMATIQLAELAQQKAQNPELKQFGQKLEQDHKRAQAKLEKIAKKQDVTLPISLDSKCEAQLSKLRELSGQEFDKEFAKGAIEGHAKAAAHLEQASAQTQDADLSQYVRDMLKEVRDHQRQAREVAKAVGIDQATITSLENKTPEGVGAPATESQTSGATSSKKESNQQKN
jgi:putative membrane protein